MTDIQFIRVLEESRPTQRSGSMHKERERDHTKITQNTQNGKFIYQINSTEVRQYSKDNIHTVDQLPQETWSENGT